MRASIVHVSDLHFASPDSNFSDDAKSYVEPALRASRFRQLKRLLKAGLRDWITDAAVITGDITTRGDANGFLSFEEEIVPFLTSLVQSPAAICMVPGNHDVVWGVEPKAADYFDRKFGRYRACAEKIGCTSSFVPIGGLPPGAHGDLAFASLLGKPVFVDRSKNLLILCVNSAIRCGEIDTQMRQLLREPLNSALNNMQQVLAQLKSGVTSMRTAAFFLEEAMSLIDRYSLFDVPSITQTQLEQIDAVLDELRRTCRDEWERLIKVAAVHHHVSPFDYQQTEHKAFETIADASSLLSLLAGYGFHLILTGHKHQPYVQRVQARGEELLVVGGSTIGGYPVTSFAPGMRYLEVEQSQNHLAVVTAEMSCTWEGDISQYVTTQIDQARKRPEIIPLRRTGAKSRGASYPSVIEAAVERQLYGRAFYKKDAAFDLTVKAYGSSSIIVSTVMSYTVVNCTPAPADWSTEYDFDRSNGRIVKALIGDQELDPDAIEFRSWRGFRVKSKLQPDEELKVQIHIEESHPDHGSAMYTSYHAATEFTLTLSNEVPEVTFDPEVLYSWNRFPTRNGSIVIVHLDEGLLPYQGVRLNWARKGQQ